MDVADLRQRLAFNVKAIRGKRGISQEKLAELADVSVQTIAFIESRRTWVSDKTLVSLASALDVDVFWLFAPKSGENYPESILNPSLSLLKESIISIIDNINVQLAVFSRVEPPDGRGEHNLE